MISVKGIVQLHFMR